MKNKQKEHSATLPHIIAAVCAILLSMLLLRQDMYAILYDQTRVTLKLGQNSESGVQIICTDSTAVSE